MCIRDSGRTNYLRLLGADHRAMFEQAEKEAPGFAFHGPSHWAANQDEFGFFVDHFTFLAGLLFAAAHGPGGKWVWRVPR